MAEEKKNIPFAYIGNALRSAAADGVTAFADEVFDTERQEYQNNINNYLENKIDDETNRAKAAEEANTQAIAKRGIYDVSAYNSGAVFESLSALLNNANLSTLIPASVRCGGMSIRFIQGSVPNSDNNYVQFRYMGTDVTTAATFTNVANWQGVDDEPIAGSDDLIKSRGVRDLTTVKTFGIVPLMQGAITDEDGRVLVSESRVCTDFLIVEQESVIKVGSPYAIRTIDKYNSDYSYNSRIVNSASLNTYTFPTGIYRVSIFKASDSSASLTPSEVEPYTYTNNPKIIKILEGLREDVDGLDTEIEKVVDRLDTVENLDISVFSVQLAQGYISQEGELINLSSRVSTDLFDATDNTVILTVSGDYAIRTANKYSVIGTPIAQILNNALLTEYTFEKGYKYKVTFCNKNNTSADINPQGVEPNVEFKKLIPIVSEVLQLNEDIDNCQKDIENIDGYAKNGYYVPGLQQGGINTNDGSEISVSNRVRTVSIKCNEDTNVVVDGNFLFQFVFIYTDSYVGYSSVMTHELLLKKGKGYRLVIKAPDDSNITPDNVNIKVCNASLSDEKESIKSNNIFASIVDGTPVNMEELLQGYLSLEGILVNLESRVTTGYFGGSLDITMEVDGDYAIRTANKYDEHYGNIAQIITGGVTTKYTFTKGYLYRVTICNKNNTSVSITPHEVADHVKLYYSNVNINNLQLNVNSISEKLKSRMLVEDDFNGVFDASNYRNFSVSSISNGKYNISQGWVNCLKMAKVVSFQNFVFEFDVNTTTNTEEIVVATEETEDIVTALYGSCAYIDMANAKMYLLKSSRFTDGYPPSISDKRVEASLTNITSQAKRYIIRFGKKDRNLFVDFINYYTGEKVTLTCEDATNSGLAGSGYDKLRIGSMSGGISVNSIVGITKTKPDVLFVGDSVTDGRSINLTHSWTYKLGEYLTDNYLIAARAGGQIQQVINLLNDFGEVIAPKVIVVSVGVNGGNTNAKFLELYNLIKSLGAIPVINTIYNVGATFGNISEAEWNNTNAYILSLSCKHIRFDIASSADKYTPVFKELDVNYTLTDSVHPASGGSELLYQRALIDAGNLKEFL